MIPDLPSLVRARRSDLERDLAALPSRRAADSGWRSQLVGTAAWVFGRLGSALIQLGQRLECYSVRFVRQAGRLSAAR